MAMMARWPHRRLLVLRRAGPPPRQVIGAGLVDSPAVRCRDSRSRSCGTSAAPRRTPGEGVTMQESAQRSGLSCSRAAPLMFRSQSRWGDPLETPRTLLAPVRAIPAAAMQEATTTPRCLLALRGCSAAFSGRTALCLCWGPSTTPRGPTAKGGSTSPRRGPLLDST